MSGRRLLVALIISFTIVLSLSIGSWFTTVPRVKALTTNFTLYAYIQGWSYSSSGPSQPNPTITVTQGDTISFTLVDGYGDTYSPHLFLLDLDNTTATSDCPNSGSDKCSGNITPTQPSSIPAFVVTQTPGTYKYDCIYHYTTMIGKFVIKAPIPDFTVTASPTAIGPINTRADGTSTITVAPTNGFSGTVALSASPSAGLNATVYPTSIPAASGTATLTVNSTRAGSYSVLVTGTGSSGSHTATVTVTVVIPDFKIALSSSSLTVASGSSASVTVTLTSLNGFSGTVLLASTLSSSGPQVIFNPVSVALSSDGSATSTLSVSAMSSGVYPTPVAMGSYNVNVTGTSGSLVHSAELALTIGSSSGAGALPQTVIIAGGIVVALAIIGVAVLALRRRPRTKA